MSNLTTIQLSIFYTLIAIIAVQVVVAIIFIRSSVRYYIMISRKIIFRNIEFIDGEIILIGKQANEEGVEKLISQQPKNGKTDPFASSNQGTSDNLQGVNTSPLTRQSIDQDSDLLDFETYVPDLQAREVEQQIMLEDLEIEVEIEKGIQDPAIAQRLIAQKENLIAISLESKLIALEVIQRICQQFSTSFLPKSKLHEITNLFDVELCQELERQNFSEDSILFYREIGIGMISSRFEEFLKGIKQLKLDLTGQEKKKPDLNDEIVMTGSEETEDFYLERITSLRKKSKRALLKTSKNLSFEIEFAVSA